MTSMAPLAEFSNPVGLVDGGDGDLGVIMTSRVDEGPVRMALGVKDISGGIALAPPKAGAISGGGRAVGVVTADGVAGLAVGK